KIVGTTPRNRIILPLSGISRVSGNIKVVLDDEHHRAFVHVSYDVAPLPRATGPAVGLDWGITEVCTDNSGVHHGSEYGPALVSMTKRRNKTGKARQGKEQASRSFKQASGIKEGETHRPAQPRDKETTDSPQAHKGTATDHLGCSHQRSGLWGREQNP
ncbi:MAG: hypothetical protein ACYDED_10845, partial [Ferrimicrobium sp.]